MLLYCRKRPAPDEGFRAAASEHRPEGCVSQDGCRLCSWGCSRVPRAVVQSRVPAVPQGLCAGAGTLPPARLSTQPACPGSCPGRCRETCGGKEPRSRAGAFCCHSCCLGHGDHGCTASQSVSKSSLQEERQGRDFLFSVLKEGERLGGRNLKGDVNYEHISENPELYRSQSAVI